MNSLAAGKLYRPCVGLCLINTQGLVFAGERVDTPGAWQMPQGGVDPGEDLETAIFRELYEETGTRQADIIRIAPQKLRYDLPHELQGKVLESRYIGQEQTWAALRFTGTDADINIAAHQPAEFSSWRWVKLGDMPDLIVPFKRETYRRVISLFADLVKD